MQHVQDLTSTPRRASRRDRPRGRTAPAAHGAGRDPEDAEARLSQRLAEFVDSGWSVPAFVARRPRIAVAVLRDIRALPRIEARLQPGPESTAVREQMMRNRTSRRLLSGVSAVLTLPAVPGAYLDGHDRATVRRKARAAARRGTVVREVPESEREALLALADGHERSNERSEYRVADPQNADLLACRAWFAAYDEHDAPIALAVVPYAGEWATLRYFRTLVPGSASSDARYLLTQAVADGLRARGGRWIADTARPHWLPNGLRHFQRMVGFRLVRVGPARVLD